MKSKLLKLMCALLVGVMLTCPASAGSVFPDVDDDADYAEAVEYLNEIGIMQGDENGNFNPDKTVTRAEMAAIICRVLGETENLTISNTFTDVPASHWANPYIAQATSLEIISGYGDGRFGPEDNVTYEQAITMIVRSAGWNEEIESMDNIGGYPDGFICLAQEHGLLIDVFAKKGDTLSRSAVSVLLYNYFIPPFMRV